jgi:hypothetical protein
MILSVVDAADHAASVRVSSSSMLLVLLVQEFPLRSMTACVNFDSKKKLVFD